ncbi:hypothetical protein JHJ32_22185 [Parapedobacter sp. ISTM3]|uniref:hypothetical protein n=1 Tax=Parapedobacter sp. ISTM3 TaxID=2800130 RepID=UPI0019030E74|nr:hypothetical protein [Parapedobacter sp. ISTM3]MBK1442725.1 hypothetical protein [Parapedobacter sp. ISTM3]
MRNVYLHLCFVFCLIFPFISQAENGDEHMVLGMGIPFNYPFDRTVKWHIKELASGAVLKHGMGPIRKLLFEVPGTYQITIEEELNYDPLTCNHPQYPEEMTIEVSPFHMEFDFSTVRLSDEIVGGHPVDGQTLSIDVTFTAYGQDSLACEIQPFTSSGVGTTIVGVPVHREVTLYPGVNTITYRLSGQARSNSYLMFDFVDINNQVQVYGLPQKIK